MAAGAVREEGAAFVVVLVVFTLLDLASIVAAGVPARGSCHALLPSALGGGGGAPTLLPPRPTRADAGGGGAPDELVGDADVVLEIAAPLGWRADAGGGGAPPAGTGVAAEVPNVGDHAFALAFSDMLLSFSFVWIENRLEGRSLYINDIRRN